MRTGFPVTLLLIAGTAGLPKSLHGELLTFEIAGEILSEPEDPDNDFPDINLGDSFTGIMRYDSETPEALGGLDPNLGQYFMEPPMIPLSFTVEGITFAGNPETAMDVYISNDLPLIDENVPNDNFSILGNVSGLNPPTSPNGFQGQPLELGISLLTSDATVLPDTGLPTQFNVDDWDESVLWFQGLSSVSGSIIDILGWVHTITPVSASPALQAGDADQDFDFDQSDLVQVQVAAKYLSGQTATWGEGDWNGAPGGRQGHPPAGDGAFDQLDIVAALAAGVYLTGPYDGLGGNGQAGDRQASIGYDASSGEVWVDAPSNVELTSINIDSAAGVFTGETAQNLGGSFDNDGDNNIFKATFGSSFGSLSFGRVAQPGLDEQFLMGDLSVVGSLAGGGELGEVDLIYVPVPEPTGFFLVTWSGLLFLGARARGGRRARRDW